MNEPTKYTAYVAPVLSHARVDAQWERIAGRLPGPRAGRRRSNVLVGVALAVAVVAVVWWHYPLRTTESVWAGSVVASDDAAVNVTLAEGTSIELDPHSEVSLMRSSAHAVQVSLSGGGARFDVVKKRARRFSVQVGAVEVLVTGTRFRVGRTAVAGGDRVRVDVEEGSVEVHRSGAGVVLLKEGDHWSAFVAHEDRDDEREAADSGAVAESEEGEEFVDEGRRDDEDRADARRRRARVQAARAPEELFAQANLARRAGRVADAAKLYGELVSRHARDRRAALAAFELGRIRMDSLSDTRGAIEALDRALKLDARRAFAEDALARLVLAHEALGDQAACLRARERYLDRYPDGVHAQHVSARCGGM